jgi:choline dehydrogenase-like flavoprotein
MRHNCSGFMAISLTPNPTVFQKTLALNDFYFRSDDWNYPLGEIQLLGKTDGDIIRGELSRWESWTPTMALDVMARHSVDFWLQSEDLPIPENRVTLDAKGGITLRLKDTNVEGHARLVAKLKQMLKSIGCHEHLLPRSLYLNKKIPIAGTAHQNGTIRFGHDPKTSALDVNCRAHDVDNLYVIDGSFFVSCGSVNPALTIIANALRVGDHLLERLAGTKK